MTAKSTVATIITTTTNITAAPTTTLIVSAATATTITLVATHTSTTNLDASADNTTGVIYERRLMHLWMYPCALKVILQLTNHCEAY